MVKTKKRHKKRRDHRHQEDEEANVSKSRSAQTNSGKETGRKRCVQACDHCRSRKQRCDGVHPTCGRCMQHKRNCTYSPASVLPALRKLRGGQKKKGETSYGLAAASPEELRSLQKALQTLGQAAQAERSASGESSSLSSASAEVSQAFALLQRHLTLTKEKSVGVTANVQPVKLPPTHASTQRSSDVNQTAALNGNLASLHYPPPATSLGNHSVSKHKTEGFASLATPMETAKGSKPSINHTTIPLEEVASIIAAASATQASQIEKTGAQQNAQPLASSLMMPSLHDKSSGNTFQETETETLPPPPAIDEAEEEWSKDLPHLFGLSVELDGSQGPLGNLEFDGVDFSPPSSHRAKMQVEERSLGSKPTETGVAGEGNSQANQRSSFSLPSLMEGMSGAQIQALASSFGFGGEGDQGAGDSNSPLSPAALMAAAKSLGFEDDGTAALDMEKLQQLGAAFGGMEGLSSLGGLHVPQIESKKDDSEKIAELASESACVQVFTASTEAFLLRASVQCSPYLLKQAEERMLMGGRSLVGRFDLLSAQVFWILSYYQMGANESLSNQFAQLGLSVVETLLNYFSAPVLPNTSLPFRQSLVAKTRSGLVNGITSAWFPADCDIVEYLRLIGWFLSVARVGSLFLCTPALTIPVEIPRWLNTKVRPGPASGPSRILRALLLSRTAIHNAFTDKVRAGVPPHVAVTRFTLSQGAELLTSLSRALTALRGRKLPIGYTTRVFGSVCLGLRAMVLQGSATSQAEAFSLSQHVLEELVSIPKQCATHFPSAECILFTSSVCATYGERDLAIKGLDLLHRLAQVFGGIAKYFPKMLASVLTMMGPPPLRVRKDEPDSPLSQKQKRTWSGDISNKRAMKSNPHSVTPLHTNPLAFCNSGFHQESAAAVGTSLGSWHSAQEISFHGTEAPVGRLSIEYDPNDTKGNEMIYGADAVAPSVSFEVEEKHEKINASPAESIAAAVSENTGNPPILRGMAMGNDPESLPPDLMGVQKLSIDLDNEDRAYKKLVQYAIAEISSLNAVASDV